MTEICLRRLIREEYNMANFCIKCGNKLNPEDNFCSNCGAKIDESDINSNNHSKFFFDSEEKIKAKKELKRIVGGKVILNRNFIIELSEKGLVPVIDGHDIRKQVEKEIDSGKITSGGVEFRVQQLIPEYVIRREKINIEQEKENEKLKMIDEVFELEEIRSKILHYSISKKDENSIKENLRYRIITRKADLGKEEIKRTVETELERIIQEKEKAEREAQARKAKIAEERAKRGTGGYCDMSCVHYYEECINSEGEIGYDFTDAVVYEYYCHLGHTLVEGRYCEDYR